MPREPEPTVVEVVYALPSCQRLVTVRLAPGMTAGEAVRASGLLEEFPELDADALALGIYGGRVEASQPLRAEDRVEIYRPLRVDPRAARRRAAQSDGGRGRNRAGTT